MKSPRGTDRLTFVEIMIVFVIIVLLGAMVIPAVQKVRGAPQNKAALNQAGPTVTVADKCYRKTELSDAAA